MCRNEINVAAKPFIKELDEKENTHDVTEVCRDKEKSGDEYLTP